MSVVKKNEIEELISWIREVEDSDAESNDRILDIISSSIPYKLRDVSELQEDVV